MMMMTPLMMTPTVIYELTKTGISGIIGIIEYMRQGSSECDIMKTISEKIELLDIEMKIKSIQNSGIIDKDIFEMIDKIEKKLLEVQNIICDHKKKWFHSWRSLNIIQYEEDLERYVQILENRLKWIGYLNNLKMKNN